MPAYAITATCVVAISSVIVFLIFYRMKVLNLKTLISVTLASLITALGLPALFSVVSFGMDGKYDFATPSVILMVSVAAYILIVVILSMIISFIINGTGSKQKKRDTSENEDTDKASAEDDNYLEQIFVNFIGGQEESGAGKDDISVKPAEVDAANQSDAYAAGVDDTAVTFQEAQADAAEEEISEAFGADITEEAADDMPGLEDLPDSAEAEETTAGEIATAQEHEPPEASDASEESDASDASEASDDTLIPHSEGILANIGENAATVENNLEISVDSNENIDKMGIENIVHNRNSLTIEDCINEAFRLKGAGDFESAILHHMYALDKKPGKELTFWIILDICVMYKSLGQQELALDILNSYYEAYGDTMDISVKEEIRRNLTAVQA